MEISLLIFYEKRQPLRCWKTVILRLKSLKIIKYRRNEKIKNKMIYMLD